VEFVCKNAIIAYGHIASRENRFFIFKQKYHVHIWREKYLTFIIIHMTREYSLIKISRIKVEWLDKQNEIANEGTRSWTHISKVILAARRLEWDWFVGCNFFCHRSIHLSFSTKTATRIDKVKYLTYTLDHHSKIITPSRACEYGNQWLNKYTSLIDTAPRDEICRSWT
jgi:hypothetical protein